MLLSCLKAWRLSPSDCLLVGDKDIDVEAARAAGIKGYIFKPGNLRDFVLPLLTHDHPEFTGHRG
jgi:D-glycero-D-manno-heptose 1,7-bisphosphate phosphatase